MRSIYGNEMHLTFGCVCDEDIPTIFSRKMIPAGLTSSIKRFTTIESSRSVESFSFLCSHLPFEHAVRTVYDRSHKYPSFETIKRLSTMPVQSVFSHREIILCMHKLDVNRIYNCGRRRFPLPHKPAKLSFIIL